MRNYQRLFFQHYFKMSPDGTETEVTRRECFAPSDDPTSIHPFKQRWYYDPEAGYAIRLPQNQLGDDLGKRNAADLKSEERAQIRKHENCSAEFDRPIANGEDGNGVFLDVPDDSADILAILEDQERLSALISALEKLKPDDRELWSCLVNKVKKQDIATRFKLTPDGVYYREKRLKSILRSDETLKRIYTDHQLRSTDS